MIDILLMGLLLGMRHAMESDHVAAVASLVTRSPGLRESVRLGSVWGLGHTLTLFVFGSAVILLDRVIPERMALGLEFTVGIMLVVLGIDVLRRFRKQGVHFDTHRHSDGTRHIHAIAGHKTDDGREHVHPGRFPLRALLVGMMHGMAGSAALIVLALQTVQSPALGMAYIALFGIGSVAGMALLSCIIMLPLRHSATHLSGLHRYLQLGIGSATTILGIGMMIRIGSQGLLP